MEINILESTPKRLVFELTGQGNTLCNAVKHSLWSNKHIKIATYSIDHPLVGVPKMIVETDGEIKPKKALLDSIEKLRKDTEKFRKDLAKIK